ncbi:MAG: hypothetical protein KAU50_01100, partial [Candidatus Marinimicrobia bacterium]|nr:hypothetical protein [Candidatus Neomarinimicrobiota bacterium]
QLLKMVELDRVVSIQGLLENLEKKSLQSMADTPKPAPKPAPVDKPVKTVSPPAAAAMETDTSHGGQSTQFEATEAATAVQVAEGTSPAHKSQAIDAINEHWTEIITAVEKNSRNAAALLEGSQVAELIDSRLTINLPDSEPIHLNMLRERRDLIEAAIEKVTGHRISVLLTIPETGSRVEHITKKTEHSALLEELIDTFKGEEY